MTHVTFQRERFADTIEEAQPLLEEHWRELARNQDIIPLDPDYAAYQVAENSGLMRVFTVRDEGSIVGYAVYFVRANLHYKNTVWATSDVIWVKPSIRDGFIGVRLMRYVEARLKAEGVGVMHTTGKLAHPALLAVLERCGHTNIEFGCSKLLMER